MTSPSADSRTDALVQAFEGLSPETLPALMGLYASRARFRDPFNDVQGRDAVERIFRHMFEVLEAPRFVVIETLTQDNRAVLTWDFSFQREAGGRTYRIHGSSLIHFDGRGHVVLHRDYWDAAQELYEQLPLIGGLMRWLRRRLQTPTG